MHIFKSTYERRKSKEGSLIASSSIYIQIYIHMCTYLHVYTHILKRIHMYSKSSHGRPKSKEESLATSSRWQRLLMGRVGYPATCVPYTYIYIKTNMYVYE